MNSHDLVRKLNPGDTISWTDMTGRFTYVGYMTRSREIYTTATEHNTYVPQVISSQELANLLDHEGVALFKVSQWVEVNHWTTVRLGAGPEQLAP